MLHTSVCVCENVYVSCVRECVCVCTCVLALMRTKYRYIFTIKWGGGGAVLINDYRCAASGEWVGCGKGCSGLTTVYRTVQEVTLV